MNNQKKIIFLGEKPLALKCLKILCKKKNIKIVGLVTRTNGNFWWRQEKLINFAKQKNIKIIKKKSLKNLKADLLISVLYPFILNKEILMNSKLSINLHQGPLPELKGKYSNYHCIINNMKYFGSTLHMMNSKLDGGEIIEKKLFKISESDTAIELYKKNDQVAFDIFKRNINKIINFKFKTFKQIKSNKSKTFNINSIKNEVKNIKDKKKLWNFVRANEFPPFSPAYIKYKSKKIYLITNPNIHFNKIKKK